MELTDQELEQLEGYYTGSLTTEERLALQQRMRQEQDYGEAARGFLAGIEALEMGKIKTHRLYLDAARPAIMGVWYRQWWLAAVVIAGLLAGGIWMYWKKEKRDPDPPNSAIVDFAEHYPRLGNTMDDNRKMTLRDSMLNVYEARNYPGAISLMEAWLTSNPEDDEVRFYLGVAYLANRQIQEANIIFDQLKYTQIEQKEAVLWYLAKCKYELGNKREALELLKIVQATGNRQLIQKADSLIIIINNQ